MSSPQSSSKFSTTATFCAGAQKGKKTALNDLLKRVEGRLSRFCYYLTGNSERAQDLSQEVYIKIMEHINTLDNPKNFTSWMFTVARNTFLDDVRSPKNKDKSNIEDYSNLLAGKTSQGDRAVQVIQGLEKLDGEERFLLLLSYLEGRSYSEVAKIMGCTEESVRCRLYRIRKQFKQNFTTGRF